MTIYNFISLVNDSDCYVDNYRQVITDALNDYYETSAFDADYFDVHPSRHIFLTLLHKLDLLHTLFDNAKVMNTVETTDPQFLADACRPFWNCDWIEGTCFWYEKDEAIPLLEEALEIYEGSI